MSNVSDIGSPKTNHQVRQDFAAFEDRLGGTTSTEASIVDIKLFSLRGVRQTVDILSCCVAIRLP